MSFEPSGMTNMGLLRPPLAVGDDFRRLRSLSQPIPAQNATGKTGSRLQTLRIQLENGCEVLENLQKKHRLACMLTPGRNATVDPNPPEPARCKGSTGSAWPFSKGITVPRCRSSTSPRLSKAFSRRGARGKRGVGAGEGLRRAWVT